MLGLRNNNILLIFLISYQFCLGLKTLRFLSKEAELKKLKNLKQYLKKKTICVKTHLNMLMNIPMRFKIQI